MRSVSIIDLFKLIKWILLFIPDGNYMIIQWFVRLSGNRNTQRETNTFGIGLNSASVFFFLGSSNLNSSTVSFQFSSNRIRDAFKLLTCQFTDNGAIKPSDRSEDPLRPWAPKAPLKPINTQKRTHTQTNNPHYCNWNGTVLIMVY